MKTQTLMDAMAELDEEIARYENSAEIDRLTGSDVAASDLDRRARPLREARAALAKVLRPNSE